ncbi:tyrosine-type recombinase/integrase [Sneathiella aquimaris]|uniref:tyrosine-type recombinase/integrase n=1 Tax=Sneathiella aquimaris TaxID=2599305 RepID=UPI00146D4984|nr:site-specific integrase [Sneathiella aquimaris]
MATIEKRTRKTGTFYRVRIRVQGLPEVQKSFTRRTDAKIWAEQTQAAIRNGEFRQISKSAKGFKLTDVIDRYREDILPDKAVSTQRAQQSYLSFWQKSLGQYGLAFLTPELINEKLKALAKAGDTRSHVETDAPRKPKSRKTLKLYRDNLAQLLKYARHWGWMADDPLQGVNRYAKIRNERDRYLLDDERDALLAACKSSPNKQLYPIVVFALSTGARKSEILNLKLDDLHLGRDTAILRDTKNGETRAVSVVHHLHELLTEQADFAERLHDEMDTPSNRRWLFPRNDAQAPIDIRKAWENARNEAGITDFRFHDLRHSTASYLAMSGASQMEIAEVLGHKTLQMVKRYAHLSESHVKGLVTDLNKKLF